ncbi:MAG TPA: cobyric acid synthase [Nocardioidaceae bacterium]|nr:cobyric acid synthase [Nocardioidaceae bacterium]
MTADLRGALLVAGTTSDAGKSVLTTGLCRWLARQGVNVAPFKAQNMSNNSMVTADGAEIGRAQWVQAIAARAEPEAAMNPVLLKPGSDRRSHVVLMGRPWGDLDASSFADARSSLEQAAYAAFDDLASRYDVVVCEGAGSPTEINLREHDFVNMGLAQHAQLPVVVVGDIDRGGVFAAMYGTLKLMPEADQRLLRAFVINKFRGESSLLEPGLRMIEEATERPVLGVLPWLPDLWLDSEDAIDLEGRRALRDPGVPLQVAVVRFPRISNFTDVDALAVEPGVDVHFVDSPEGVKGADLVVLPGTRATLDDLAWLRQRGLEGPLVERHRGGEPILGICGGFQMLGQRVADPDGAESGTQAASTGLGLLPARTTFRREKVLGRPRGHALGHEVDGYEIHHGEVTVRGGEPFLDGCREGATWGTLWHGAFENDGFRRAFLEQVASDANRVDWKPGTDTVFADQRERRIEALADAVEEHLDTRALLDMIASGGQGSRT